MKIVFIPTLQTSLFTVLGYVEKRGDWRNGPWTFILQIAKPDMNPPPPQLEVLVLRLVLPRTGADPGQALAHLRQQRCHGRGTPRGGRVAHR
jgi:hypothetical protein